MKTPVKYRKNPERNIFLEIEYLGANFFGFQVQEKKHPAQRTVQGVLEKVLHQLFQKKIRVIYAGRTDRGVHALGQVVNFTVSKAVPLPSIKQALNGLLPHDIRVKKIE